MVTSGGPGRAEVKKNVHIVRDRGVTKDERSIRIKLKPQIKFIVTSRYNLKLGNQPDRHFSQGTKSEYFEELFADSRTNQVPLVPNFAACLISELTYLGIIKKLK